MTSREAADLIRQKVRVTRSDLAAAKDFILQKLNATEPFNRRLALRDIAEERVRLCGGSLPPFIELDDDPLPALNASALNISLRAGVFLSATELADAGYILRAGTTAVYEPQMSFSSGHGRHKGGETIDLAIPYYEAVYANPRSPRRRLSSAILTSTFEISSSLVSILASRKPSGWR